jgi:DNA-binding transcriptional LysR family regulator
MPFAAERYVADHGTPVSVAEAAQHKLVWQRSDQIASDALALLLDAKTGNATIAIQTNTSSAHYWAVARGAGIGLLPTYVAAIEPDLVPIDIGIELRRDLYVVRHHATAHAPHVDEAVEWLRAAFDPVRYPWFDERFVHPRDFARATVDPAITARLDALVDG